MTWQVIGDTARGITHLRSDKPNQDAWGFAQSAHCTCLAVADGHGSDKHYRSDIGAKIAVTTALELLQLFAEQPFEIRPIKQSADYLASKIVQAWRSGVDAADQEQTPISQRYSVYGTTLIAVLLTNDYVLYLQLGDGDLLILDASGQVQRPLHRDAQLLANETYSLGSEDALYHVEMELQFFQYHPQPAFIFLATDGYANSFADDFGLCQAVQDFQTQINSHGKQLIQSCLNEWLHETSELGSGDDVTVAILVREE
ncbi:MAG: PP2C family serine/threonine-protein phosphatase [Methylococcaceae bacterium]